MPPGAIHWNCSGGKTVLATVPEAASITVLTTAWARAEVLIPALAEAPALATVLPAPAKLLAQCLEAGSAEGFAEECERFLRQEEARYIR